MRATPVRLGSTPTEIIEAIAARLRKKINIYNDANCFVSDQEIPTGFPPGKECCTVSLTGGAFSQSFFTGGGQETTTEDLSVTVTTLIRHLRDRPRQREQVLLSVIDGMLARRRQILGALLADDFDLTSTDGKRYLLRDQLTPQSTTRPAETTVGSTNLVGASIIFHAPFDWSIEPLADDDCGRHEDKCFNEHGELR